MSDQTLPEILQETFAAADKMNAAVAESNRLIDKIITDLTEGAELLCTALENETEVNNKVVFLASYIDLSADCVKKGVKSWE